MLLAIQRKDEAFELMMAPVSRGDVAKIPDLIALHSQLLQSEDKLVALWASFHAERVALERNLRILPANDWRTFYDQIDGQPATKPGAAPLPRATPPRS